MKIKSIREAKKIKGCTAFLRVDFNVPLIGKKIKDESKIIAALPTIRFLLRAGCPIIIATHWGDPKGKKNKNLSTKPLAKRLEKIIGKRFCSVIFSENIIGEKIKKSAANLKAGEILFLENLRFNKGEEKNETGFAKKLAKLADFYVNEAFSVCHRQHASVKAIKRYLPGYSGLLLTEEIKNLDKIKNPAKPLVVIMGGAKINTKINLIKNLYPKASHILIGGALANNFFKAKGYGVGESLIDKESVLVAKKLIKNNRAYQQAGKIILPLDVVVSQKGDREHGLIKKVDLIGKKDCALDIGPETIHLYANIIKEAKTIIWNGPLGAFEEKTFRHGTLALATLIAARSRGKTFGVIGGGETLEALKMTKMEGYVDWISMGGGAMLAYLGGEKMPGLS
ncbi:MAG: phosphoglycerate kinase [Patescibacteria group bacterium]|jgi:3-phosphoglycerate kinase